MKFEKKTDVNLLIRTFLNIIIFLYLKLKICVGSIDKFPVDLTTYK